MRTPQAVNRPQYATTATIVATAVPDTELRTGSDQDAAIDQRHADQREADRERGGEGGE